MLFLLPAICPLFNAFALAIPVIGVESPGQLQHNLHAVEITLSQGQLERLNN